MNPDDASQAQPSPSRRPLEGLSVGISVALGEDAAAHGFGAEEMNRATVRISDALLANGARLVFGHDWRPNGIMSAVARLAVAYDPGAGRVDDPSKRRECRITNLVPWGSRPELPGGLREDLEQRGILRIEEVSLPPSILDMESQLGKRTLRAAGLSLLRRRLADLTNARICLGGKFEKYEGFWPGILEEAFITSQGKPETRLLLCGLMGGASGKILRAARTNRWSDLEEPRRDDELRRGLEKIGGLDASLAPRLRDLSDHLNWDALAKHSGLGNEDWLRFANAGDIEVVAALAYKALHKGDG